MPAAILKFKREFDATNMTIEQIKAKARELGWPGLRIDANRFHETGVVMVSRMSRKAAYGDD